MYYFVVVSLIPFVQMIFINILRQVHCESPARPGGTAQLTRMPISMHTPAPAPAPPPPFISFAVSLRARDAGA